jgi:hypothetical protein
MRSSWGRRIVVFVVGTLATGATLGGAGGARSAWEAMVARDPGLVDDERIGWEERLALAVLTPQQALDYRRGVDAARLTLADGRTLREYLEARLTPPAGVYVGLSAPCLLFGGRSDGEIGTIEARGVCGIPRDALAVVLELRTETFGPTSPRVKVWAGDLPEPAAAVLEADSDAPTSLRQTSTIVNLCAGEWCAEDLRIRSAGDATLETRAVGYFRPLGSRDGLAAAPIVAFAVEGPSNNFFGDGAGAAVTTGVGNSFFGANAGLSNTEAFGNSFFGFEAGQSTVEGSENSFFGAQSGAATTGDKNSFFGGFAGFQNTSGNTNAFFGYAAGYTNTVGYRNSGLGSYAGFGNTTGDHNVFVGWSAGNLNTIGDDNTFLGSFSNPGGDVTNATAVGYQAQVNQSNSLVLGSIAGLNGADASVNVGIGVPAPQRQLHLKGSNAVFRMDRDSDTAAFLIVRTNAAGAPLKTFVVGTNAAGPNNGEFIVNDLGQEVGGPGVRRMTITNAGETHFTGAVHAPEFVQTSSLRFKNDVTTLRDATATVDRLRGVSFIWKDTGKPAVGLIAEEVAEVIPEVVAWEENGLDAAGVNYSALVAVLVEAVKAQQDRIQAQEAMLEALEARLARLEGSRRLSAE